MVAFDFPDVSTVKDFVWIGFAFVTLWLAKSRSDIAIKALNHNAQLVSYKHSLEAHHAACGVAFCFAPEVEDHLIELHAKYDDLKTIIEKKQNTVSDYILDIDFSDDVYKANLGNIYNLNSDSSSFLVSYFKFLKRAVRDVASIKNQFLRDNKTEHLEAILEIYHVLIVHGIRAYIELIHTGYESNMAILKSGGDHYEDFDERIEQIGKNYMQNMGLIKGRYYRINAAPIIEQALGAEMRKKYENLEVTVLPAY